MNLQSLSRIIESPLPVKLVVELGLFFVFFTLRKKDTEGYMAGFIAAIVLAAVRDILFAVFPLADLYFVSDLFLFSMALFLFIAPFGSPITLVLALTLNLACASFYTVNLVSPFMPLVDPVVYRSFLAVDVVILCIFSFICRSKKETVTQMVLTRSFLQTSVFFIIYVILVLGVGYENSVFHIIVVPLFYGWFLFIARNQIQVTDTQMIDALDYYENSINSLYNLMLGTGSAMKSSFSMTEVLEHMNETVMGETGASGGIVFLFDEFDDVIQVKSLSGVFPPPFPLPENLPRKQNRIETYMKHLQLKPGETIFGEVAHTGKQVFIPDASVDSRIAANGEESFLRLSSLIVVPLMIEERIIGVLALSKCGPGEVFSETDFDKARLLSNFGSLAISNFYSFMDAREKTVIDKSAGIAAEIQRTIVPRKLPEFSAASFGAFSTPAKGVSGDYYDVIQTRKDRVLLAVGDVASKGVSAALIMVMVRSILHLVANTDKDVRTIMQWINRGITGKIEMDHYATIGLLSVNLTTGEVEYASANHQPIIVYRKSTNAIETLEIKSLPIGVERNVDYPSKEFRLADGDIVALYTDGIVEAMNAQGKQYGRKNMGDVMVAQNGLSAKDIANKIKTDLATFVGSSRQHDDQTVLVMKMKL